MVITNPDNKMIICNCIKEFCEKSQSAVDYNFPTDFNLKDFCNMKLFNKYLVRMSVTLDRSASDYGVFDTEKNILKANIL